jgi:multimeric flavodoxin WrbA
MNVMGVVGSPRSKGNTAALVRKVLEGAESKGVETKLFCLGDYQIGGCRACMACKQTGECVQDDDMKLLHAAIREAKVLVLGTPIYLDHVSAQTKVFLDRLYSYLGPNLVHRFPKGVKGVLVFTWGASGPEAYDDVITWMRGGLSGYFDVETVAVIKAADTGSHPVSGRDDLLQRAFEVGVGLAECG